MISKATLAAGAFALLASIGGAGAVELQSYRAFYDLSLAGARQGSGVGELDGKLALEWADACDGYTLVQRMGFNIRSITGDDVFTDVHVSTWESRDGTILRFNFRSSSNGVVVEEYQGRAQLEGPGKAGVVTFTKPDDHRLDLPPGTVFPTEHTIRLLEAVRTGERRLELPVFEGSTQDAVYQAVAFIGDPVAAGAEKPNFDLIADLDSWPVQLAYFQGVDDSGVPDYEIRLRLFANGIGDSVYLDYGDFMVSGRLSLLEALPSGC